MLTLFYFYTDPRKPNYDNNLRNCKNVSMPKQANDDEKKKRKEKKIIYNI